MRKLIYLCNCGKQKAVEVQVDCDQACVNCGHYATSKVVDKAGKVLKPLEDPNWEGEELPLHLDNFRL